MLIRDIKGIYLPAALVMTGLSQILVSQCAAEPVPPDATGPSATSMVCFFYYFLHLFIWIPVGILLVVFHVRRYRPSTLIPDQIFYTPSTGDSIRIVVCSVLCGFIALISFLILGIPSDAGAILLVSLIFNFVPASVFFAVGALLTMQRRSRIQKQNKPALATPDPLRVP